MNLAGHRDRRLSENYFEPCKRSWTPCEQSLLLDLEGEKEALPELHQSFEVTVAHLTIQSCFLWSN